MRILLVAILALLALAVWVWKRSTASQPQRLSVVRPFGLWLSREEVEAVLIREGHAHAAGQKQDWTWIDLNGAKHNRADLDKRIQGLFNEAEKVFGQEDLSGADLSKDHLSEIGGDVSSLGFVGTNLSHVDFSGTDLNNVQFDRANLTGAILRGASSSTPNSLTRI